MKQHFQVEVRGFEAGETDIRDYLTRVGGLGAAPELEYVYQAAYEATHDNPDGQKYCSILVIGHADRVPAGSEEDRRKDEEETAEARADYLRSWTLDMMNAQAAAANLQPLPDWPSVEHVTSFKVGVGAAALVEPAGTIAAAKKNRRVEIVVAGLNVSVIDQHDGQEYIIS